MDLIENIKKKILLVFSVFILSILIIFSNEQLTNRIVFHSLNSFLSDASFNPNDSKKKLEESIEIYLGHSDIDYNKDVIISDNNDSLEPIILEWNLDVPKPNKLQIIEAQEILKKKEREREIK